MEPIEHRVTRLECRVDAHDEDISEVQGASKTMNTALDAIQNTLLQIKWLGVGAVGAFVVHQVGLVEVAKKVIGL